MRSYLWRVEDFKGNVCQVVAEDLASAELTATEYQVHENGVEPTTTKSIEMIAQVDWVEGDRAAQRNRKIVGVATKLAYHYLISDTACLAATRIGNENYRGDGLRPELKRLEDDLNTIRRYARGSLG